MGLAIAAKDKAGKLWLALTNLDPNQPAEIEVSLTGLNAKSAAGETLTAPKVDSVNTSRPDGDRLLFKCIEFT